MQKHKIAKKAYKQATPLSVNKRKASKSPHSKAQPKSVTSRSKSIKQQTKVITDFLDTENPMFNLLSPQQLVDQMTAQSQEDKIIIESKMSTGKHKSQANLAGLHKKHSYQSGAHTSIGLTEIASELFKDGQKQHLSAQRVARKHNVSLTGRLQNTHSNSPTRGVKRPVTQTDVYIQP